MNRSRLVRPDFDTAIVVILFTAIATAACFMPAQSDTYWQLRAGQEIVSSQQILLADTFTHTVRAGDWPNHEWLSEVAFFLLHRAGGMPLLTLFCAAAVTIAAGLSWCVMTGPLQLRLALILATLIPTAQLWSLRPQVLSLAMLATLMWLLNRQYLLLVLPLIVLWANAHAGVTIGLAALGGATAGLFWSRAPMRMRVLTVCVAAFAAACATPLGWRLFTEVPAMLARLDAYGVQEWRAPSAELINLPFWAVVMLLIAGAWRRRHSLAHEDAMLVGAACALVPLALSATRNGPPFLLIAAPALSRLAPAEWRAAVPRVRTPRPWVHAAMMATAAVAAGLLVISTWRHPPDRLNWAPLPGQVLREIESCAGNLYNSYDTGGYVTWFAPRTPVFIDSRQDPFPSALVLDHIHAERTGEYGALFERFQIGCALVARPSVLQERLVADGWTMRAEGGQLAVLAAPPSSTGAATE